MGSLRALLITAIALIIAGCGFQLRSTQQTAGAYHDQVLIQQNHSDNLLRRRIKQQLAIHNVVAAEASAQAQYRFVVDKVERSDTVLTLDSDVRTAERLLIITAELSLLDSDGNILQSQLVREQRVLFTDPENPVGSGTESQLVVSELEEAAARQIALQLTRWLDRQHHEIESGSTF
ncbi:LPS assembly lipoprotein LptE [Litorivivens sp.]|uniref:LPS-assembly lipoprotein LptE n=1 Tax=Litorivivens sp. TaxID=2020868 RepID=UPI00356898B6